jgi:O-antigen/teichoic acid export membrane protein
MPSDSILVIPTLHSPTFLPMQLSQPLTLRHNFSWTLVGNTIYAASQWGMLVLLAKLGNPEMVGQFTLGLAVTAPVFMLTNLQLRGIQATDATQRFKFSDYLGLRLLGTGLALVIILGIALIGYRQTIGLIILLIALAKALESVSDVVYGLLQQHERMDRVSISLMLRGCLSLCFLGIGLYLTHHLFGAVLGLVIVWAVVLIGYDLWSSFLILKPASPRCLSSDRPSTYRDWIEVLQPHWHWQTLRRLIAPALPMGTVMMLISLNSNIPRYVIEQHLGTRELGIFAAIAYLIMAGGTIVGALGQAATPRLAKYYATGNRQAFRRLLFKLMGMGAGLGAIAVVVALVAGRQILTLLYQPEYAQYTTLFVWLMVAGGISYVASFMGYGMTAAQYFYIQLPLFIGVTAVSSLTCFWLIPSLGLIGAAFALILAAIVQVAISAGVILYAIHRLPNPQDIIPSDAA